MNESMHHTIPLMTYRVAAINVNKNVNKQLMNFRIAADNEIIFWIWAGNYNYNYTMLFFKNTSPHIDDAMKLKKKMMFQNIIVIITNFVLFFLFPRFNFFPPWSPASSASSKSWFYHFLKKGRRKKWMRYERWFFRKKEIKQ